MAALKLKTSSPFASKSTWHTWPAVTNANLQCQQPAHAEMAALKLKTSSDFASKSTWHTLPAVANANL
eukprot:677766-Karenia_brevis.AAC.1